MRRISVVLSGVCVAGALLVTSGLRASAQAPPVTIRQVAGAGYVYAVRSDGSVIGWGRPDGSGGLVADGRGAGLPRVLSLPGKVEQIAATDSTAYALMVDGTVFAWGANDLGQFGKGPGSSRTPDNPLRTPSPMTLRLPDDIVQIATAGGHALAVRKTGAVLMWGDGSPEPVTLSGLSDVIKVAAAGDHDLALTRGGLVFAWGENKNGQLGAGIETTRRSRTPVRVPGLEHVVDIAASGTTNFGFSGAVTADGVVWMWGSDQSATMGDGVFWGNNGPSPENHATPVSVKGVTTATSISVGQGHVLARLGDRTLRMWGHDGWGQIGVGTSGFYQPLPKKPAMSDVSDAWAVGNTTYALKTDGTLWWWGVAPMTTGLPPIGKDQHVPALFPLPN